MYQLGMLVGVSHTGEQTFWDVLNTAKKPIIASLSSVYNLYPFNEIQKMIISMPSQKRKNYPDYFLSRLFPQHVF